jgi:MarR family transcriptional regulator, organic hydroperoxide resistance regulator
MSQAPPMDQLLLQNQICFAVHSASHAFTQAYKPLLAPLKLTYPQYLVMLLLWEKDNRSVSELGAPLFLDSGTLSPLLKRLRAAGYVTRSADPVDERVTRIALTPEGAALKTKAAGIPAALLCATGLESAHLAALRDQLQTLGQTLRATS